jgi:hypothetical protein
MPWDAMSSITDLMPHTIKVYKKTGTDRYGKTTYGAWTPVRCLISGQQRLVRATDGSQQVTSSVIYCYSPEFAITAQDKLELADGTTPPILAVGTETDELGVPCAVTIYLGAIEEGPRSTGLPGASSGQERAI